ncbi:MAG: 4,5-DOPA dioxygenase extradiol [Acidobacteriota bacterium]|nr:4,5-DOPA dioxygenase extradiol [Acidobacteriota bacterium]
MARHPVLFVGHGSPMNAIEDNVWSRGHAALAALVPRPRAILAVSAHWESDGTFTTLDDPPPTIHDFGGFPAELYAMRYPAPGEPALARRAAALTGGSATDGRGLDHGTWSVLHRMFPAADVPVAQLSLDVRLAPGEHLALGRALLPLRDEGVLILGSGNLTHDLRDAFSRMRRGDASTPDWAARFDADAARALAARDEPWLVGALDTPDGRRAHPTAEHWLPILYAAGAADARDAVSFPVMGFDLGSLSMRCVLFA